MISVLKTFFVKYHFVSFSKIIFLQAGKLNTYRFCDNVWTFMLNDVEFREVQEIAKVSKVKVVACDGKGKILRFCMYLSCCK